MMNFNREIQALTPLVQSLKLAHDLEEKEAILLANPRVSEVLMREMLPHLDDLPSRVALYSVVVIKQHHMLLSQQRVSSEKIRAFFANLVAIDRFYAGIGGIVGYHLTVLRLLAEKPEISENQRVFSRAPGLDLSSDSLEVKKSLMEGIRALGEVAEIYPIGGLATRLNAQSKTCYLRPAASLPFCGRTLLEGLVRDVQAREFLYYRLFKKHVTIPIAMMTSLEKMHAESVTTICKQRKWFGRPEESFYLFSQISVPVVTQEGQWSWKAPYELNLQPGGHGALWQAAYECGVFEWLQSQEKRHVLIRQINNPIAGLDLGLLAFVGYGKSSQKTFGFVSCERLPHAAEGALVLVEEDGKTRLSNIEYTEFKKHGISDKKNSSYPANTNILYANLERILPIVKQNPLPGLMLNMKHSVPYFDADGTKKESLGGRLESMMQNISDAIVSQRDHTLSTFLTYNVRKRTISTTKRQYAHDGLLLETPEGAFYDLLANAYDLLKQWCQASLPPFCSPEMYLKQGPSVLFLYNPALGPLYSLIAQKIQRLEIAHESELQLEIADIVIDQFHLKGSCLITAKNVLGHMSDGMIRYSQKTGKCILKNVRIFNEGIHRQAHNIYWQNTIHRTEAFTVVLEGNSEFYAENVTFKGDQTLVVPDGERWVATQDAHGQIHIAIEKPSWQWEYLEENQEIALKL